MSGLCSYCEQPGCAAQNHPEAEYGGGGTHRDWFNGQTKNRQIEHIHLMHDQPVFPQTYVPVFHSDVLHGQQGHSHVGVVQIEHMDRFAAIHSMQREQHLILGHGILEEEVSTRPYNSLHVEAHERKRINGQHQLPDGLSPHLRRFRDRDYDMQLSHLAHAHNFKEASDDPPYEVHRLLHTHVINTNPIVLQMKHMDTVTVILHMAPEDADGLREFIAGSHGETYPVRLIAEANAYGGSGYVVDGAEIVRIGSLPDPDPEVRYGENESEPCC